MTSYFQATKQFVNEMAPWLFALAAAAVFSTFIILAKAGKLW